MNWQGCWDGYQELQVLRAERRTEPFWKPAWKDAQTGRRIGSELTGQVNSLLGTFPGRSEQPHLTSRAHLTSFTPPWRRILGGPTVKRRRVGPGNASAFAASPQPAELSQSVAH